MNCTPIRFEPLIEVHTRKKRHRAEDCRSGNGFVYSYVYINVWEERLASIFKVIKYKL
jgi:hypothetical protein